MVIVEEDPLDAYMNAISGDVVA